MRYEFASDNTAGLCPPALDALHAANDGHVPSYGDDRWTEAAADGFRDLFETDCDVYFVFNGTAANALALASLCRSYHAVITTGCAHVETDECGAPEFFSNGSKLLVADAVDGRLDPDSAEHLITRRSDIHYPRPRVLSLTQCTEVGTVYDAAALAERCELARRYGLAVHLDGARFANALAEAGEAPAALSWRAGVDVLCFGGTKNGVGLGEAVIFFDRALADEFAYRCKQAGQLASKMRYLAAPWAAALRDGFWLDNARHANRMAAQLAERVDGLAGVRLRYPRQANSVFLDLTDGATAALRERGWACYSFIGGGVRFMCNWSTTEAQVRALADDMAAAASPG